jgi:hypothetical protein
VLLHLFFKPLSEFPFVPLDLVEGHSVAEHQIIGVEHLGKLGKLVVILRVLLFPHPHLDQASSLV